jgi:hypothetical protein
MTCFLCTRRIRQGQPTHEHHAERLRSEGGATTEKVHASCHVRFHSQNRQFREWGRRGGITTATTRRWSFNLRNVKDNPAFDFDRKYYTALYARGGSYV